MSPIEVNMTTRYFYRDLHVLASFEEAANGSLHAKIPDDWFVIVADIAGSTEAIENGRYKDVNTVGAATIMAVINVDRTVEIPFTFGGEARLWLCPLPWSKALERRCLAPRIWRVPGSILIFEWG
jgi:hypothetical protein